ncbi:MAG: c-type cytochrome [Gammaproteobacteria bacterium]
MAIHPQKFFDGFMLLLGVCVGAIAGIALFADFVSDEAASRNSEAQISADGLIEERIRSIGQVALLGDPDVDVVPAAPVAADDARVLLSGAQVYNDGCSLCHAAPGIGGAPVFGDQAAWAPRVAQNAELLEDHVMNGYQGDAGLMPPKGGLLHLTDGEILAAIDFMLEAIR